MKVRANERFAEISEVLSSSAADARPWEGVCYRVAAYRYAKTSAFLSGEGSLAHGGRFIAPGVSRILHVATVPELALAESLATRRRYGLSEWEVMPFLIRGVEVRLQRVLDLEMIRLGDDLPSITELIRCSWEELNDQGEEAPSQALGRAALELRLEGLLVRSAVGAGRNLAVLLENLAPESSVRALGEGP